MTHEPRDQPDNHLSSRTRLEALIAVGDDEDEDVLALIKAAPGNVSLDTMLAEI